MLLICSNINCKKQFNREPKKAKYNLKKGYPQYCSKECVDKHRPWAKEKRKTLKESFFNKLIITEEDSCWGWRGSLHKKHKHGKLRHSGQDYLAYRLSWEFHRGVIPPNISVCHSCDNRACCNPKHLFLGTQKDNVKDMVHKNRQAKGEKIYGAVLTPFKVRFIRRLWKTNTYNMVQIANLMEINYQTIVKVIQRKTWRHVV